jgi:hypothetical protein
VILGQRSEWFVVYREEKEEERWRWNDGEVVDEVKI